MSRGRALAFGVALGLAPLLLGAPLRDDRQEVRRIYHELNLAYALRDAKRLSRIWAADAVFVGHDGKKYDVWPDTRKFWSEHSMSRTFAFIEPLAVYVAGTKAKVKARGTYWYFDDPRGTGDLRGSDLLWDYWRKSGGRWELYRTVAIGRQPIVLRPWRGPHQGGRKPWSPGKQGR